MENLQVAILSKITPPNFVIFRKIQLYFAKFRTMQKRIYDEILTEKLKNNRIILVKGPKSSQKSTYLCELIAQSSTYTLFDGEDKKTRTALSTLSVKTIQEMIGENRYVLFKEAQNFDRLQEFVELFLFSGNFDQTLVLSCSFDPLLMDDLVNALHIDDAVFTIFPPLFQELANEIGVVKFDQQLTRYLIFGSYPQVLGAEQPQTVLEEVLEQTIFTHLNPEERINKSEKLMKMLQFMAFKLGEPLSYNEIGEYAGLDNETVERYIDLLVRSFVLLSLPSYCNDHKYELKKTHTFYFTDNGIRNALIKNFNEIDLRIDVDILWRNWLIAEKMKWDAFIKKDVQYFFWRTHTKQQMDFIEIIDGNIFAYKSLWDKKKRPKFPKSFTTYYPTAGTYALNRSTYWGFLSKKN